MIICTLAKANNLIVSYNPGLKPWVNGISLSGSIQSSVLNVMVQELSLGLKGKLNISFSQGQFDNYLKL